MINYKLHSNGWTVLIEDFDFKNCTPETASELALLVSTNMVVVIKGKSVEDLSPEDQVNFCSMIGTMKEFHPDTPWMKSVVLREDDVGIKIQRITGEKDSEGHPGLFGHKEALDWHVDHPWDLERKVLTWLKSVKGCKGSRTSWYNTKLAYDDFKKEDPDFIQSIKDKNLRLVTGWKGSGARHTPYYDYWVEYGGKAEVKLEETAMPLIFVNESGQEGFYIPYYQTFHFHGMTEEESRPILDRVWNYCQQDKYLYNHDWEDGGKELVLSEQWLSVHKRWEFEKIEQRFLHRIAVDYSKTSWWPDHKRQFQKQILSALKANRT